MRRRTVRCCEVRESRCTVRKAGGRVRRCPRVRRMRGWPLLWGRGRPERVWEAVRRTGVLPAYVDPAARGRLRERAGRNQQPDGPDRHLLERGGFAYANLSPTL